MSPATAIEIAPEASVPQLPEPLPGSAFLRQQTRTAHERAEVAVIRRLNRRSRNSYVRYLERAFGFYSPLEAKLLATSDYTRRVADFSVRRKVPWLLDDLRYFGREVDGLPLCSALPELGSGQAVLGVAYVFEGATLGGPVLLRSLGLEPAPSPARGGTFLSGYGPNTAQRWQSFQRILDEAANNPSELAQMVQGARQAFALFEDWIAAS